MTGKPRFASFAFGLLRNPNKHREFQPTRPADDTRASVYDSVASLDWKGIQPVLKT